jgi:hypothetical protein
MKKPYRKLRRADLEANPIWTWVDDQDDAGVAPGGDAAVDESWVSATPLTAVPAAGFAQYAVACTITLKDGSRFPGIAEVTVSESRFAVRPDFVFLLDRHLRIPAVETNRLLARYTRQLQNHPVAWTLGVVLEGENGPRSGTIRGGDMREMVAVGLDILMSLKALRRKDGT